jgi:hypothetical protein
MSRHLKVSHTEPMSSSAIPPATYPKPRARTRPGCIIYFRARTTHAPAPAQFQPSTLAPCAHLTQRSTSSSGVRAVQLFQTSGEGKSSGARDAELLASDRRDAAAQLLIATSTLLSLLDKEDSDVGCDIISS